MLNPFVMVLVARNETKGNLSKSGLTNATDYYKSSQTKEKAAKSSKSN